MSNFKCDPQTRLELDASPSKKDDAAVIQAALGLTGRRIICKRDANANAADPWATGTVFRNVGSTGALKIVAGKIVNIGKIKGTTVSLAADTSTGSSVLRIQNANGTRWIQGSIGPNGDFLATVPFTATNGLSVTADFAISGKQFKASGTGPAAPALDANAPHTFEVWNYVDPANPFMSGSAIVSKRDDDFIFEDEEMAQVMGDVAIYQTPAGILHGSGNDVVEFGFTLMASHQGNTEVGNLPLYEVVGAAAVRGDWTTYPASDTYDQSKHLTYPAPFKVVMKNAAGAVLYTWQMDDGSPINSAPQQYDSTHAMHPHWNTGMQLPWENTRQAVNPNMNKYYAGMDDIYARPSIAKVHYTAIGVEPLLTGGYQGNSRNGLHNLWATDRMPQPNANHFQTPDDPYGVVNNEFNRSGSSSENAPWADGWDYEPGAFGGHNWYTGPGGPRFDRSFIPSIYALFATNPNAIRPLGAVPIKDMAYAWMKNQHNHSNHWCRNPNTMQLATDNDDLMNNWRFTRTYYDSHPVFGPKIISIAGDMRDGDGPYHRDKTGRFIWSGWCRDTLHSYSTAGWAALIFRSPRAAICSKWDTFYQMSMNGNGFIGRDDYMVRSQAWNWLHFTIGWKLGSQHRLGLSQAQLETMFQNQQENHYNSIEVPVFQQNEQSNFANGLRNLGIPGGIAGNGTGQTVGAALGYYMAGVLMLQKQTGFWSKLKAKGGYTQIMMERKLALMDKYCFEKTVYTNSVQWDGGGYQYWNAADGVPLSWQDYTTKYSPIVGQVGLFHNQDGSIAGDRDVGVHPFCMYPYVRKYFFPEYPHALLDQTIAKLDVEFGGVTAAVAAQPTPADKRNRDHTYGYPGVARIKAPTVLGPV